MNVDKKNLLFVEKLEIIYEKFKRQNKNRQKVMIINRLIDNVKEEKKNKNIMNEKNYFCFMRKRLFLAGVFISLFIY